MFSIVYHINIKYTGLHWIDITCIAQLTDDISYNRHIKFWSWKGVCNGLQIINIIFNGVSNNQSTELSKINNSTIIKFIGTADLWKQNYKQLIILSKLFQNKLLAKNHNITLQDIQSLHQFIQQTVKKMNGIII